MKSDSATNRKNRRCRRLAIVLSILASCAFLPATAQIPVLLEGEAIVNTGSGTFAPYYIASNRHGIITQQTDALFRAAAFKPMDTDRRFSYSFGIEFLTGYSSANDYKQWDQSAMKFDTNSRRPASIWLQQLYGEVKYRGVFLTAGLKQHESALLNFELSSGDLILSGNARPIPEIRVGFIDFQNIPFTNGWVQIQGEIGYGKFTDNDWMRNHYNYFNGHIAIGSFYNYKRCYFRTKPSQPFSLTIGMQAAGVFGGTTTFYRGGKIDRVEHNSSSIKTFFKMFIPTPGGEGYYTGNSLGSWDVVGRYRLPNGSEIKGYMSSPWETGSGIGKLNGFDGLWGLEYKSAKKSFINGAVVEYFDFTNQSGSVHWDPANTPGTTLNAHSSGCDNYYNNGYYNSYANYGMAIGSPVLKSPIYNLDGYLRFVDNRVRGFHAGISGNISPAFRYRVLGGYRKSWGSLSYPYKTPQTDTSVMIEGSYKIPQVKGLAVKAQVAFDHGKLYGNNIGGCLSISYSNLFDLKK